jgi:hypothetical protein
VSLTTLAKEVRFAETIVKEVKVKDRQPERHGPFCCFSCKSNRIAFEKVTERFTFGKTDGRKGGVGQQKGRIQHRTILVMGATSSGKPTRSSTE